MDYFKIDLFGRVSCIQQSYHCNPRRDRLFDVVTGDVSCNISLSNRDISGNHISKLPSTIGALSRLKILNLSNNKLSSIDSWMGNFPKLENL